MAAADIEAMPSCKNMSGGKATASAVIMRMAKR